MDYINTKLLKLFDLIKLHNVTFFLYYYYYMKLIELLLFFLVCLFFEDENEPVLDEIIVQWKGGMWRFHPLFFNNKIHISLYLYIFVLYI